MDTKLIRQITDIYDNTEHFPPEQTVLLREQLAEVIRTVLGQQRKFSDDVITPSELQICKDHGRLKAIRAIRERTNLNLMACKSLLDRYWDIVRDDHENKTDKDSNPNNIQPTNAELAS